MDKCTCTCTSFYKDTTATVFKNQRKNCVRQVLHLPGQVRAPLELTANVATPLPDIVTPLE